MPGARWAAAARRRAARRAGRASAGSNGVRSVHDSSVTTAAPAAPRRPPRRARTRSASLAPGVQPGRDVRRDRVDAVGRDVHLAAGGDGAVALGRGPWRPAPHAAKASIGSSRSARRVVPAWLASPARSSRQRPCGRIAVPTPTARPGRPAPRPCSTCSSTNVPIRPSASGSGPQRGVPRPRDGLGHRHAVGVGRARRPARRSSAPVSSREPAHATPNRAPSSSPKHGHAERARGAEPVRAQRVERGERGDDAERAVERAAVGHRVQVRAGDDAGPVRVGIAPPGPQVAGPVGRDVQPAGLGLAREPVPQLGVLPGPGEPPVPAGARIAPDGGASRSHGSKPRAAVTALRHRDADVLGRRGGARPRRSPRRRAGARPSPGRWSAPARASPPRARCRRPR